MSSGGWEEKRYQRPPRGMQATDNTQTYAQGKPSHPEQSFELHMQAPGRNPEGVSSTVRVRRMPQVERAGCSGCTGGRREVRPPIAGSMRPVLVEQRSTSDGDRRAKTDMHTTNNWSLICPRRGQKFRSSSVLSSATVTMPVGPVTESLCSTGITLASPSCTETRRQADAPGASLRYCLVLLVAPNERGWMDRAASACCMTLRRPLRLDVRRRSGNGSHACCRRVYMSGWYAESSMSDVVCDVNLCG